MTTLYIFLVILLIIVLYVIYLYNTMIRRNNVTEKAFGAVDAMLKKRYDLIPNLVETVRQYMIHEASVLEEVTRLRSNLPGALPGNDTIALHNDISKKLSRLMVSVENYPDLKASLNFLRLQGSWNEAEEQIAAARRYYNTAVAEYNDSIQTFPARLIARMVAFNAKKVLETPENERGNIHAGELFNHNTHEAGS
jgi:LemA protein